MNILLVIGRLPSHTVEGTRKSVVLLANELSSRGHHVSIVTREMYRDYDLPPILSDTVHVHYIPMSKLSVLSARRFVKEQDPDVINVHTASNRMALFWHIVGGKKTVVTYPTYQSWSRWQHGIQRLVTKTVVTSSVQERVAGESIVTPYGIDTSTYTDQNAVNPDPPSLFYLGTPNARKGFDQACNVLSNYENEFEFRVAVSDDRWNADTARETLLKHEIMDRTELTTEIIDDVPAYMNQSDILLNLLESARNRTCPPILTLEAMSCGRVPICTDIPEFRNVIDDGVNGFLVDNTDYEGIAEKIRWLREHPEEARAMGQRARNRILETHSVDVSADAFVDAYQELVE